LSTAQDKIPVESEALVRWEGLTKLGKTAGLLLVGATSINSFAKNLTHARLSQSLKGFYHVRQTVAI